MEAGSIARGLKGNLPSFMSVACALIAGSFRSTGHSYGRGGSHSKLFSTAPPPSTRSEDNLSPYVPLKLAIYVRLC